jgi:hypothetical protein
MHPGRERPAGRRPRRNGCSRARGSRFGVLNPVALAVAGALLVLPTQAGHEVSYYPSFYPQEIRIEPLDRDAAAREFANTKDPLHAYVGAAPRFAGPLPESLKSIESLGSFVVLSFNPKSPRARDRAARCAAIARAVSALAKQPDLVAHTYPITPFHADYLTHADRVALPAPASEAEPLTFFAGTAGVLVTAATPTKTDGWDARLDEIAVSDLLRAAGIGFNQWPSPPWTKEGWFQAYHLLRPSLADAADRERADKAYDLLTHGEFKDLADELSLERSLLSALTRGCDRTVIGYRVRREFYSDELSNGVENILVDSQSGFNSALFVRTVKLKDFPWNGWLRLGIERTPAAGWNPVGGFTDPTGRLIWAALADNAFLPISHESGWLPNRVELPPEGPQPLQSIRVPADAVMPQAGTGQLETVGTTRSATGRVTYRLSASAFHDGTEMDVADLLYPFALAFRWGVSGKNPAAFDPEIAAATQWMRERLRGVRIVQVEERVVQIADLTFKYRVPIVEVYLDNPLSSGRENPLLAPPWSSVPWHVLALMEAAVERGIAAFSKSEAERRGLPWLDLVREPEQRAKLLALVKEFAASGYRPAALEPFVTVEAAKARWQALEKFAADSHHLLPTNGPYRLSKWSPEAAVLEVIRDFTYPVGLGTFDIYPYPPQALITDIDRSGNRVLVAADYEISVKQQRFHRLERGPFTRTSLRGTYPIRVQSRYILLQDDGRVAAAGDLAWERDGQRLALTLPQLPAGGYTLVAAVFLDGNTVRPSIGRLGIRIE